MPKQFPVVSHGAVPDASLLSFYSTVLDRLPPALRAEMSEMRDTAAVIESNAPAYLALPACLSSLADDLFYAPQRPYGRAHFREWMHEYNESGELVYSPRSLSQVEVLDFVDSTVRPADRELAVLFPLAARVGFVVGWLSALSISQREEAHAGLLVLATLVTPLLSSAPRSIAPAATRPNRATRRARRGGKR